MTKIEIHEHVLQFLIEQKINFLPRQKNLGDKLKNKYWLLYGPKYSCVSFWEGFDADRKVPNIALFFGDNAPFKLRVVLNSRSDSSRLPLLREISKSINLTSSGGNEWSKDLATDLKTIPELNKAIGAFLQEEKVEIDNLVEHYNHPKIKAITDEKFTRVIAKINLYREVKNKIDFSSSDTIGTRKRLKRKGVKSKSEEEEIRSYLAKRLAIKKTHNKLQNQLFNNLSKIHSQSHLIMEENYIDLKFEDDETIILYEVKPYSSITRCIKESLGQLMGYYYNLSNPKGKKVELVIAGPKELKEADNIYLNFVRNQFKTELKYISIE